VSFRQSIPGRLASAGLVDAMDHANIAQLMLFLAIVMLLLLAIVEGWK
jgi:hypothetical protein